MDGTRVWLKAFWGFDPSEDGMLGFTRLGDRSNFIANWQPGDLVLIYGASSAQTDSTQRRQALGFLEIEPVEIPHTDRLSPRGSQRRIELDSQDRWTYAVPAKRAWRVTRPINIKSIAPFTYSAKNARNTASRGMLMQAVEASAALALPVKPVNVFGEAPVDLSGAEFPMASLFSPSRGLKPTFGSRTAVYADGDTYLYLHKLEGQAAELIGRSALSMVGKVVVKIGYSNDPTRRSEELNAGFPPASRTRWKTLAVSGKFPSAEDAKAAEDFLKAELAVKSESLGREFFLGAESTFLTTFASASRSTAMQICAVS
ncbi:MULTISPECIES: GIY-YIG nuclease family protein [unclassified Neorhizobium]|uniref:GIY-YIG nuclease family protein n=1 Tax=unclassified Neorhizobium TaxID=2629175 RepID=UPI001FF68BFE|nr:MULTISPECIES: GIY-YIG nuclease family protein [unclassified Neorhizobium]MCJ9668526.1 GIY-YIG nuclease family protein [Neorhizobium sp. SHOUNA12B]MCJ9744229.1 GIY-YIG nuclease family protein [Neorhizobium sp. SHOUNA12A]